MEKVEFNIGAIKPIDCVREAWESIKSDYWLLFAISIVGALISGATLYVLFGALACGIFYCFLRKVDGETIAFDDLWKGFGWFGPGLVVAIAIVVPMVIIYGVIYGPILAAMIMGQTMSQDDLVTILVSAFAIDLLLIVIMVCFHTLLMFSFPLIVDRGLSGIGAITTSAKAVWKNMSGVAGLIAVNFGLVFVGYAALCFGIYLVIPVLIATNAVAYRKVFPRLSGGQFTTPPPPTVYEGI